MNYNYLKLFFLPLLLISNLSSANELQLAKIKKNRFYYCFQNSNSVAIKELSSEGSLISQKDILPKKINKIRKSLAKQNIVLKDKIKSETKKNRKLKFQEKIKSNSALRSKLLKCLKGQLPITQNTPEETEQLPLDLALPPEFSSTNVTQGTYAGSCTLKGININPYEDNSDARIRMPESGQLNCQLTSPVPENQDLLLKITKKGEPATILFSSTIYSEQIKADLSFAVVVCQEFPGCFYANLLAKHVSEAGIDVIIENLPE